MPLLGLPQLVGDPESDDPEPRVGGVEVPHAAQHIGVDEQTVVVQLHDDVHVPELPQPLDAHVPSAGAAEVLVQFDGGDLAGQGQSLGELGQRTAVAHDHDPRGRHVLLRHGLQQGVHLGRPVPHGHHGDGDPRRRLHALTPTRPACS